MTSSFPVPDSTGLDLYRLDERAALVTGAGGGIGRAVAAGLAAAGAQVAVMDRDAESLHETAATIEARGGAAVAIVADVRDAAAVEQAVARIHDDWRPLGILVNSAAVLEREDAIEYRLERFRHVVDVNLLGTFVCCQVAARAMAANGGGSIVNFASIAGLVGYAGSAAYIASKGAVVQLTKALAVEWAPHGIRVNAVAPGSVDTPMTAAIQANHPEFRNEFLKRFPIPRPAQAVEMVGPTLFLCSDASSIVTGHVLAADGGFTAQ